MAVVFHNITKKGKSGYIAAIAMILVLFVFMEKELSGQNNKKMRIKTGKISESVLSPGSQVDVPYTIKGKFPSYNIFIAQLSDPEGSFDSPSTIGYLFSNEDGVISSAIPSDADLGTGYRIRVISLFTWYNVEIRDNGTDLTITRSSIWVGGAPHDRTNWNNAANWTGNIPGAETGAVIKPSRYQPVITDTHASAASVTISEGASLTIESNASLEVYGQMTNEEGYDGLILVSDNNSSAGLIHNSDDVPATFIITVSGAEGAWHFISSPVEEQVVEGEWTPSGTYGNGTGYDLYLWDEESSCWIYYLSASETLNWNKLNPGNYFMPARGYLYSLQEEDAEKEFRGILNNGEYTINISSDGDDETNKGFNLAGNPYPSVIDWQSDSGWDRNDLKKCGSGYNMWIWNPEVNNYGVVNSASGEGTNGVGRYIAPMQGFFVKTNRGGTLSVNNNARATDVNTAWFKSGTAGNNDAIRIRVSSEEGKGSDEVIMNFGYYTDREGAQKLFSPDNTAPSLYINSTDAKMSMQYLTDTTGNPSVALAFEPGTSGCFTLEAVFDSFNFNTLVLEDRQLNTFHNLLSENKYLFTSSQNDDPGRFIIHFTGDYLRNGNIPASIYNSMGNIAVDMTMLDKGGELLVADMSGRIITRMHVEGGTLNIIPAKRGNKVMLVVLDTPYGTLRKKIIAITN